MTAELKLQNQTIIQFQGDVLADKTGHANQSIGAMDMLKRDRFELLSAYLDGEVTATERRQVEEWLANDPEIKRLYARLLQLRQGLRTMPVPAAEQPVEQTVQQVYQRLHRRSRRAMVLGGSAIAALFIGALSGVIPSLESFQIAKSPEATTPVEPLMVALNTPVVEIPKAPIAAPEKPSYQIQFPRPSQDFN